ncbi:MAG TPA: carbohydrate kinase [Armatimonadota bacterium]|jgi:sugar/nucleoside kinase (ribokinase family)
MPDIITLGEPIIDLVATEPSPDLVSALHFTKAAGGAPINVAAACAKLGASAGVIAKAGGDHFGDFMRETLEEIGVDTDCFLQDPEYATQLAFVSKDAEGVPDFAFHVKRSADTMLEIEELDYEYLAEGLVFHFGTISLIHDPVRSTTREALRYAQEQGLLISLDPNLRPTLWPSQDAALRAFWSAVPECDVLKVSEEELQFLTAEQDLAAGAAAAAEMGPTLVLVTRGPEGAYFYRADGISGSVPGFAVEVVDTVGCGDTFVAAMLTQLVDSEVDLEDLTAEALTEMVRFANAAAACTATGAGVMGSLPDRAAVEARLKA